MNMMLFTRHRRLLMKSMLDGVIVVSASGPGLIKAKCQLLCHARPGSNNKELDNNNRILFHSEIIIS